MIHPLTDPYWMDCYQVLQCDNPAFEGKTIGMMARERQPDSIINAVYDESLEVVFDILVQDPATTWALIIDKRESGVLSTFFQHRGGLPCTDVAALPATPTKKGACRGGPAPIAYGMFPHYIRTMVKEEGALSLEEAIRKITSLPAQEILGLEDRGVIKEGAWADLVVMDIERLRESDDFLKPNRPPKGIEQVLVNGKPVYKDMAHTGQRPGQVLRRNQKSVGRYLR
jgi:N-acyl-D-aspartate/D-glutamate deacylase